MSLLHLRLQQHREWEAGCLPHRLQLLVDGRSTCSLYGKLLQVIPNIPFTTATAGKRARPSGNGLHIHPLFKQALNVAAFGATAMTHDLILWAGRLRFH
jgi:hypothetical protein